MASGSHHMHGNALELVDAARNEIMKMASSANQANAEKAKIREEIQQLQQQTSVMQETMMQCQFEAFKQQEIGKRMQQTMLQFLPLLPAEYQGMLMQEMDKARGAVPDMNAAAAAMLMGSMNPALLGMRNMMMPPMSAAAASPRGKPNGMPNGLPAALHMMAGQPFPGMPNGLPPQFAHPMVAMSHAMSTPTGLQVSVSTPNRTSSNGPGSGQRTPLTHNTSSTASPRPTSKPNNEMRAPIPMSLPQPIPQQIMPQQMTMTTPTTPQGMPQTVPQLTLSEKFSPNSTPLDPKPLDVTNPDTNEEVAVA